MWKTSRVWDVHEGHGGHCAVSGNDSLKKTNHWRLNQYSEIPSSINDVQFEEHEAKTRTKAAVTLQRYRRLEPHASPSMHGSVFDVMSNLP